MTAVRAQSQSLGMARHEVPVLPTSSSATPKALIPEASIGSSSSQATRSRGASPIIRTWPDAFHGDHAVSRLTSRPTTRKCRYCSDSSRRSRSLSTSRSSRSSSVARSGRQSGGLDPSRQPGRRYPSSGRVGCLESWWSTRPLIALVLALRREGRNLQPIHRSWPTGMAGLVFHRDPPPRSIHREEPAASEGLFHGYPMPTNLVQHFASSTGSDR